MGRKRMVSKESYKEKVIPTVKTVVGILGAGALLGASVIMPATPVIVAPFFKFIDEKLKEREEIRNSKFDKVRLWVLLRRLEKQKEVELITLPDGSTQVSLTDKGRVKHLRYKLEDVGRDFSARVWDSKWRIIIFDVPEKRRSDRNNFRTILHNLKFYQLQKSVYLTPYPCENEMEYLRQYYGLGAQVQMLVTDKIENDQAYRLYFGLT